MPNYWILKTEPSTYSFEQLVAEGATTWDGVTNPVAIRNIKSMARGDQVMIYHTGDQKAIVGLASVVGDPGPDLRDSKLAVVQIKAGDPIPHPVTLAAIKADPRFADLALVRQGRLSVVPVPRAQWDTLLLMGGYSPA